jgi:hypothetical protein
LIAIEKKLDIVAIVVSLRSQAQSDARKQQEIVMLSRLVQMILVGAAVLAATSASAQTYDPRYPVCMRLTEWGGGPFIDCSFTSLPQCNASASGRAAQCEVNPYFAYAKREPSLKAYRRQQRPY